MASDTNIDHTTNFTVSIEAAEGVTTCAGLAPAGRPRDLMDAVAAIKRVPGAATAAPGAKVLRTYGVGAQILKGPGREPMRVLSAPKPMLGLAGFDLGVVEYVDGRGGRPAADAVGRRLSTSAVELPLYSSPFFRLWPHSPVDQLQWLSPMDLKTLEGDLLARDLRFVILAARFNDFIVDQLVRGAVDSLKRHGAGDQQIEIVRAPGAFDLPVVARKLALTKRYDAIIALGAVIKGATAHFDFVAGECAGGLSRVAADTGVPVAFGVLTTETIEQAVERAGTKAGNKGADAALTAIELANLLRKIAQ